jgi:amino acid transporter
MPAEPTPRKTPDAAKPRPQRPRPKPPARPQAPAAKPSEPRTVEVAFRRDLGLLEAVMLGIGAMVGGGIFALMGIAIGLAGPIIVLGLAANGLIVMLTAMSYMELGARIHEAGGGYRPVDMSMPPPFGFLAGWMAWFARAVACGLYAVTFGVFAVQIPGMNLGWLGLSPHAGVVVWGLVVALGFFAVNFVGTHLTGRTENLLTGFQVMVLAFFTFAAAFSAATNPNWQANFTPFIPYGPTGLFLAMAIMYITFEGSELITTLGEEIKEPRRNIPRAIFLSVVVTVLIYVAVTAAAIAAVGWSALAQQGQDAMIYAAQQVLRGPAFLIIVVGGLISALAAMNAALLASSRVAFAMGRRRHLPAWLSHIHVHFRTPSKALVATTAIILFMVAFLPLDRLAAAASLLFLLTFILVSAALIKIRLGERGRTPGFRVPLFPLTPIAAIVVNAVLAGYIIYYDLFQGGAFNPAGAASSSLAVLWIAFGLMIYWKTRGEVEVHERFEIAEAQKLPEPKFHVMVSVGGPIATRLMSLARDIAKARDGVITLLNVMQLPRAMSVMDVASEDATSKRIEYLHRLDQRFPDVDAKAAVVVARDVAQGIVGEVERRDVNLLMMGWRGTSVGSTRLLGSTLEPVIAKGPCDILVLRATGKERYRKIAVASLSQLAANDAGYIAGSIARQHESTVTVLQGADPRQKEIVDAAVEGATQAGVSPSVKHGDGEFYGMVSKEGEESDLLILGTTHHSYRRGLFGDPLEDRIAVGVQCAVAIVIKAVSPVSAPVPPPTLGPGEGQHESPPV